MDLISETKGTDFLAPLTSVLLGIPFHDVTMEETLDWIDRAIARRDPTYLVTANLDFAAQASGDIELQRILVEADLVLCDGTPLVWASKLAGTPLRERVAGSDLVPRLAGRAEEKGHKIFLLGGEPAILERAAANLMDRHPGLPPVKSYSPPFAPLHEFDHETVAERVRQENPDILLVAFGCPKQEKWIFMHYCDLGVPCTIGVGATVDFLAGKVSRAPKWIAKAGLEWVYRMIQEPKRLVGRYAKDIRFLFEQTIRERRLRKISLTDPEASQIEPLENIAILKWTGNLCLGDIPPLPSLPPVEPLILDLSKVSQMDRAGLGLLLQTAKHYWRTGTGMCLLAPSKVVQRALTITRLERIFDIAETMEEANKLVQLSAALHQLRPITETGDILSFRLPERLIAANARETAQVIKSEWEIFPDGRTLHLDFGETRFMDSSGLGLILRCRKLVDAREGGILRLDRVGETVRNVIKLARLEKTLFSDQKQ